MKTKKNLQVTLFLFLLSLATANAQLRFGIRAEAGLNEPSFSVNTLNIDNLNSFKVGPTAELMFPVTNVGLEASILYSNNKTNVKNKTESGIGSVVQEVSNHYLDVPVNLKYKIGTTLPLTFYAAGGPYARFLLSDDQLTYEDLKDNIKTKNFKAGINLGAGAEIFNRVALGANYEIPLADNYSVEKPEWSDAFNGKKGVWSITATLYF